ncbi:MAG: ABC transporter ATP-binding protein [Anaerolineae bacterium]|nr:ABC transporter ATP-binding protein [Anaerolineae bacterium]
MSEIIIRTENLSREFGAVRAVDQLSFEVPAGVVFGFLGPNGSGKTTTIRLLLGLLEPSAGRAEIFGFDTRTQADRIRERCGALLEHHGLYERMSAEANLDYYGRINHLPGAERQARIKELLDHLGLWERRKEGIGGWSKGMKQKLAVARALLHRPALLFLDEPTSGFDPVAAVELRRDLARMVEQEGVTVFLTTHNLAEAEKLCGQAAVIREGRLLAVGDTDELRARSAGPRAEIRGRGFDTAALQARPEVVAVHYNGGDTIRLDLRPGAEVAPLVSWMVGAGAQIEEVRRVQNSLEDFFLSLMEASDVVG